MTRSTWPAEATWMVGVSLAAITLIAGGVWSGDGLLAALGIIAATAAAAVDPLGILLAFLIGVLARTWTGVVISIAAIVGTIWISSWALEPELFPPWADLRLIVPGQIFALTLEAALFGWLKNRGIAWRVARAGNATAATFE